MDEHAEMCECEPCTKIRQDFSQWCDQFDQRWAARKAARAELPADDMSDPAYNSHPAAMGKAVR